MVGGFPAFPDWLTGCSATVATLLQPNMWVITAALRAGNVAPPGQFLVDVDGSAWCAPFAAGQPCYETADRGLGRQHPGRDRGLLGAHRLRKRAVRSARLSGRHHDCGQPAEHPSRSGPPGGTKRRRELRPHKPTTSKSSVNSGPSPYPNTSTTGSTTPTLWPAVAARQRARPAWLRSSTRRLPQPTWWIESRQHPPQLTSAQGDLADADRGSRGPLPRYWPMRPPRIMRWRD